MAEKKKDILWRIYIVFAGFVLFGLAIVLRVGHLQFSEGDYWKHKADSLTLHYLNIQPMRGNIYACDGSLLATSLPRYDVHMDMIASGMTTTVFNEKLDSLSMELSRLFNDRSAADYKHLLKEARRDKERYFLLKRNISFKEQKALQAFPLLRMGKNKGGLILTQLSRREKPFKMLASRTIGFKVDNSIVTPVGIEGAFDKDLEGTKGKRLMQRIAGNVWKPVNTENEIEPMDGRDVVTTIDVNLQDVAENALQKQLIEHNADRGCAILMEVSTGQIKAIANLRRSNDSDVYQEDYNYAIGMSTEPGSTFKLASMMAGMEDSLIDLDDTVDTQNGKISYTNGFTMTDSHEGGGKMTMKRAFAISSNVGISKLITKYYSKDPQKFIDRIRSMHIADPLVLQLPGEGMSRLKDTKDKDWSHISLPYISIGYESTLTPLQLLTFYNAVANNGRMVKPLFVKEIRSKGQVVKSFGTKVISDSICSHSTIVKARKLLEEVVLTGTASAIRHAQYTIAGKTGTAQIAGGKDGYKSGGIKYQASFCGYFPADKPQYSCIVVVYAPGNDVYYGASVACPVFKEIADKVFSLNVKMHDELRQSPDSLYAGLPPVKAGRSIPALVAVKKLNLNYDLPNSGWINSKLASYSISVEAVPNVVGMGLRDAVYLLESQGLLVRPVGRGTVIKQSINAGAKYQRGQQITIELG